MPYVQVADPTLNTGKPGQSADIKQIRDNQDFFNDQINSLILAAGISEQSIADDFAGVLGSGGIASFWDVSTIGGSGTITTISEHTLSLDTNGAGAANYAIAFAKSNKIRIDKTEEYVAVMECRVKSPSTSDDYFFFGWQDSGLAALSLVSDTSDCIGVIHGSGGTGWRAKVSNGGSSASSAADFGTFASWGVIKLVVTCSATAGTRKVESYLDGVLQDTFTDETKFPTAVLMPVLGVDTDGAGSDRDLHVDYAIFTFQARPLAA